MPTFKWNGKKTPLLSRISKQTAFSFLEQPHPFTWDTRGKAILSSPSPLNLIQLRRWQKRYKNHLLWQQWYHWRPQQCQASLRGKEEYEEEYLRVRHSWLLSSSHILLSNKQWFFEPFLVPWQTVQFENWVAALKASALPLLPFLSSSLGAEVEVQRCSKGKATPDCLSSCR